MQHNNILAKLFYLWYKYTGACVKGVGVWAEI